MKKTLLITWLSAILFSFLFIGTSCNPAKKAASSTTSTASNSLAANQKALLWKISGKDVKKSSYLFGTIHLIPEEDYFMPDYVETAFGSVENVVFEINTDDMNSASNAASMMQMMFMEDGKTLKDILNKEDYKKVKAKIDENPMLQMMGGMVDRMKPFFISMMMEQSEMGVDPMSGAMNTEGIKSYEMEFTDMAKKADKPISGLETVEYQMSMFNSIPLDEQARMLMESINEKNKGEDDTMEKMVEMYKNQDIPGLHKFVQEQAADSDGSFEDKLLNTRNKNWIPLMAEIMPKQTTFFAVGAAHLGGIEGVIALLRKEGYTVSPVLK